MNWAAGYLIKSAIEKSAKRWFWRLAQLPVAQRIKAVERIAKATGQDPKALTWGSLASFPLRESLQKGLTKDWQNAIAKRQQVSRRLWGKPESLSVFPGDPIDPDRLNSLLFRAGGSPKRYAGLLRSEYNPVWPKNLGPHPELQHNPSAFLERFIFKDRPGAKSIPMSSLSVDPQRFVYRGAAKGKLAKPGKNIFASAHPEIAAGYGTRDPFRTIVQLRRPKGTFFTPHFAEVDPKLRREKLRGVLRRFFSGESGVIEHAGQSPLGSRAAYETVIPRYSPESIVKAFRVSNLQDLVDVPLSKFRQKAKLIPIDVNTKGVAGRILKAQEAWDRPVVKGLPEGFKP